MSKTPSETIPHVASRIRISTHAAQLAGLGGSYDGNTAVAPQPAQVQSTPPITSQPAFHHDIATHPSVYGPVAFYVLCLLAGGHCFGVIALSPGNVKRDIAHHLSLCHGIPTCPASRAPVCECTWLGCACTQRGVRCGSRLQDHTAHVKDLADHIIHSHLDFFYACDRCGRTEWSTPWALRCHRQQCRGRVAVRCTGCLNLFVSRCALEDHVKLEGCYATTH